MNDEINAVAEFFSKGLALDDMTEYTKNGLKPWEKAVAAKCFPSNTHILDVACGMGREAFALYDMGYRITAADISETVLEKAKLNAQLGHKDIQFLLMDGIHLPFADSQFDSVIMWAQAFGNLYGEEKKTWFLKECHRVMIQGGLLCFSGHDESYVKQRYPQYTDARKFFAYADTDCYWELFTAVELKEFAEQAGFKVLECGSTLRYDPDEDKQVLYCVARKS
jgi:ubiquinone/menaquinone biosynthesis C-methylase UbiE